MYDDEDDYPDIDYDQIDPPLPSVQFRRLDAVIIGLRFVTDVTRAFHEGVGTLTNQLMAHYNYEVDQRDFADAIRADLEAIPTTTTED